MGVRSRLGLVLFGVQGVGVRVEAFNVDLSLVWAPPPPQTKLDPLKTHGAATPPNKLGGGSNRPQGLKPSGPQGLKLSSLYDSWSPRPSGPQALLRKP